jgi:hypothetical protein
VPTYDSTAEYMVQAYDSVNGSTMSDSVLVDPEAWRVRGTAEGKRIRVHLALHAA